MMIIMGHLFAGVAVLFFVLGLTLINVDMTSPHGYILIMCSILDILVSQACFKLAQQKRERRNELG